MSLTPQQLKTAFFNILKTDTGAASVAVRASLGNGASSVIDKAQLKAPLPATPFVALWWNSQPSGGPRNRGNKVYYPIWLIYDDTGQNGFRIEALQPLIEAAYPEDAIKMCFVDFLPARDLLDQKLNFMPAKSMAFQIRTRG